MKLGRLNYVGVATPSIEQSIASYRDVLGATVIGTSFDMPEQGVRVRFVDKLATLHSVTKRRLVESRKPRDKSLEHPWKKYETIPL